MVHRRSARRRGDGRGRARKRASRTRDPRRTLVSRRELLARFARLFGCERGGIDRVVPATRDDLVSSHVCVHRRCRIGLLFFEFERARFRRRRHRVAHGGFLRLEQGAQYRDEFAFVKAQIKVEDGEQLHLHEVDLGEREIRVPRPMFVHRRRIWTNVPVGEGENEKEEKRGRATYR